MRSITMQSSAGFLAILLVLAAEGASAQQQDCRAFVQDLYSYLYRGAKSPQGDAVSLIRKRSPNAIAPELRKALDEDLAAARKNKDEIVGLDFDPFSGSQDPGEKYTVEKAAEQNQQCRAEVFATVSGKKSVKPDVIVELTRGRPGWQITNFRYPGDESAGDLVSLLKQLAAERRKTR